MTELAKIWQMEVCLSKKSIECVVDTLKCQNVGWWIWFQSCCLLLCKSGVYRHIRTWKIILDISCLLVFAMSIFLLLAFNVAFHQYQKWPFCFSHIATADARRVSHVYITCVTDWSDVTFYPFPIFFLSVILENPAVIFFSWMSAGVNQCSPRGCSQQGQLSFCLPEQNKQICLLTWALAKINFIGNSVT